MIPKRSFQIKHNPPTNTKASKEPFDLLKWVQEEEENNKKKINNIYTQLRFYIRQDGNIKTWVKNYSNIYIRLDRETFLSENKSVKDSEING